ncbi:MAG TPA: glycosyltransferase family 2 protein [Steroidobacteraceae bacterium]|nr:glycosyltransferase family 2 protein [Steroidobacteraceae bacterium]
MLVSIVIRTLNEARYLGQLLEAVSAQVVDADVEVVIIDSGSVDATLKIAGQYGCRITHIHKHEFTFGRSLNRGCEFARGDILVFLSGHCIPEGSRWLAAMITPLLNGVAHYTYGRQIGRDTTKYSERKIFRKYFPDASRVPQKDFFCNNANSAILRDVWSRYRFDEEITGLEDMELAKRIVADGSAIAYVAEAAVFHIHDESWRQTKRRYEREAIALQKIMPEVHVSLLDMIRYTLASIIADSSSALRERCFWREFAGILKFRTAQYWGTYRGNHEHRKLSQRRKENYFYPNKSIGDID